MSDQQNMLEEFKKQLHKFSQDHLVPTIEEDEEKGAFRKDLYQQMGALGITGITNDEQWGGLSLPYSFFCRILEVLAQYSASYAVTLSVSTMVQSIIEQFGNADQKQKFLPELVSGQEIGAFALSETHSGSDASGLKTIAKKVDGGYQLNGRKMWITSGGLAKTYIVMAKLENDQGDITAFIVQNPSDGFSFGKPEKKMGWKSTPTTELIFDHCFVPEEQLLGKLGQGFKISLSALDKGRISIGSLAIGLAQAALDTATKYSLEREQFQQKIFDFQGLQFILAENATELEASRQLVYHAAHLYDQNQSSRKISSMAKLKATDMAMKLTTDAVQVLGGVGYTQEFPVERFMRDAKVLQIVEGTNQIQKVIIGRELKKEFS
jgi:acyl-CoA dehydrogenase